MSYRHQLWPQTYKGTKFEENRLKSYKS